MFGDATLFLMLTFVVINLAPFALAPASPAYTGTMLLCGAVSAIIASLR